MRKAPPCMLEDCIQWPGTYGVLRQTTWSKCVGRGRVDESGDVIGRCVRIGA